MLYSTTATLLSCLLLHAAFVSAQGKVTSPPRREVGPAYRSCSTGQCDFGPCQGLLFEDNKNNVQRFLAGQQQTLVVDAQASSPGLSKVSVVDIATNAVISDVLDQYTTPNAKSKTGRTITIPNLSPRCSTAGECVLLHTWEARDGKAKYQESCIDFTISTNKTNQILETAAATQIPVGAPTGLQGSSLLPAVPSFLSSNVNSGLNAGPLHIPDISPGDTPGTIYDHDSSFASQAYASDSSSQPQAFRDNQSLRKIIAAQSIRGLDPASYSSGQQNIYQDAMNAETELENVQGRRVDSHASDLERLQHEYSTSITGDASGAPEQQRILAQTHEIQRQMDETRRFQDEYEQARGRDIPMAASTKQTDLRAKLRKAEESIRKLQKQLVQGTPTLPKSSGSTSVSESAKPADATVKSSQSSTKQSTPPATKEKPDKTDEKPAATESKNTKDKTSGGSPPVEPNKSTPQKPSSTDSSPVSKPGVAEPKNTKDKTTGGSPPAESNKGTPKTDPSLAKPGGLVGPATDAAKSSGGKNSDGVDKQKEVTGSESVKGVKPSSLSFNPAKTVKQDGSIKVGGTEVVTDAVANGSTVPGVGKGSSSDAKPKRSIAFVA